MGTEKIVVILHSFGRSQQCCVNARVVETFRVGRANQKFIGGRGR